LGSPLGALVKADAEKWWPIIKTPGLRQSDAATVTRAKGCAFDACNPANCQCRLRVKNGCGGRSTGTSAVPQIADDFGASRKSAEVGQIRK
jgi:hypothetical protein